MPLGMGTIFVAARIHGRNGFRGQTPRMDLARNRKATSVVSPFSDCNAGPIAKDIGNPANAINIPARSDHTLARVAKQPRHVSREIPILRITAAQMARLRDTTEARFARAEAARLARDAPSLAATAGQAGLQSAVHLGLAAARRAGLAEPGQIRLYLRLMMSLGTCFDTDPQYRFLHFLLDPSSDMHAIERSRLLHWHATRYFSHIYGPDRHHALEAATRLGELDTAVLAETGADFERRGPALLMALHPRRVDWLSDDTVRWLMRRAEEAVAAHRLDGPASAPLMLSLMFSFGHRADTDRLYPWIGDTLADPALIGAAKTEALAELYADDGFGDDANPHGGTPLVSKP